jgi:hypothetical protein
VSRWLGRLVEFTHQGQRGYFGLIVCLTPAGLLVSTDLRGTTAHSPRILALDAVVWVDPYKAESDYLENPLGLLASVWEAEEAVPLPPEFQSFPPCPNCGETTIPGLDRDQCSVCDWFRTDPKWLVADEQRHLRSKSTPTHHYEVA